MRLAGRWVALAVTSVLLLTGCSGVDTSALERAASATTAVAVPTCARPPCGGGPGSIRWSRTLPTGSWRVSEDGDYRIAQKPPPTQGSTNEFMPAMFAAGTASTLVVTLADHVLAFDARTGAPVWSLPASRLPAHAVLTGVRVVDGMVWLEVTQEFPTATWHYDAVLVDLTSGRIQADIAGYHAALVMATPTRAIVENFDVLQGVDRSTGRIVWTHPLDKNQQSTVEEVDGRVLVSLPPKTGQARSLVLLDPRDGRTVATMTTPHDVDIVLSRGHVLYFAGRSSGYAYDTVTKKTLWRVTTPAQDNLTMSIDPANGAAYVIASLAKSPYTATIEVRIELSGRRTSFDQLLCGLRAATTVQCSSVPSPTSRARGGPAGGPTTWQSPPIPEFAQFDVEVDYPVSSPVGPGPTYVAGVSCPTSQLATPPSASPGTTTAGVPFGPPAQPVCRQPHLVVVNRT